MATMRVAIIGTGMSGLNAIKECKFAGLEPVAFEKTHHFGGVWNFTEHESVSSVYRSTHINTNRDVNSFGDFPIPADFPLLLHWTHMMKYFEAYVEKFQLRQHIRFHTEVISCKPHSQIIKNNKSQWNWAITSRRRKSDEKESSRKENDENEVVELTEIFDAVLVCTGHHSTPRIPDFPGLSTFKGYTLHSHAYKDNTNFYNKRVIVVGIGNSGSDIVTEISKVAKQTYLISRQGTWIMQNGGKGEMQDPYSRLAGNLLARLPHPVMEKIMESSPMMIESSKIAEKAGLKPSHGFLAAHPTVTLNSAENNLLAQLEKGVITVKKGLTRFSGDNRVTFVDGTEAEVDAVVFCTGYKFGYPWLDKKVLDIPDDNSVALYNYMWPLNGYNNIAWIALVQPVGSMVMICEQQNRYAVSVFKNQTSLPPLKSMIADAKETRDYIKRHYYDSPRHTIQVYVRKYLDKIGEEIGITPTFWRLLFKAPWLLWLAFAYPTIGAHYRLVGPGANPKAARQIIYQEWKVLYSRNANFKGWRGLLFRLRLLLLIPFVIYYQLKSLFTTGKFFFDPVI